MFILIDLSSCPWWLLSILSVTFHTNLLSPRRTTDTRLHALDGLIYSIHRFRMCASPIKGLTVDVLVRFICFVLSLPLDHDLIRAITPAQIPVAELAYGRKRIYGWHPSNPGSGYDKGEGEVYRALAMRRIEENESFN
jgi:coenzyme A diphosphatase NUDT7